MVAESIRHVPDINGTKHSYLTIFIPNQGNQLSLDHIHIFRQFLRTNTCQIIDPKYVYTYILHNFGSYKVLLSAFAISKLCMDGHIVSLVNTKAENF